MFYLLAYAFLSLRDLFELLMLTALGFTATCFHGALLIAWVVAVSCLSHPTGQEECLGPHVPVFHMVLKMDEQKYIREGRPLPSDRQIAKLTDLRACQDIAKDMSCCKDDFFQQIGQIFQRETDRFAKIQDHYKFLVPDWIQPAVQALRGASPPHGKLARLAEEEGESIEGPEAAQAVLKYMMDCEEVIKQYFSAALCGLCDKKLGDKLTEDRYMLINEQACTMVYTRCAKMPETLEVASDKFAQAAGKFAYIEKELERIGRQSGRKIDIPEVSRAHKELETVSGLLLLTSDRIWYYKESAPFCRKLNEEGYVYDPEEWGRPDLLHPSVVKDSQRDDFKKLVEKAHVQRAAQENPLFLSERYAVHEPTQCVNGKLESDKRGGKHCVCEPCWSGNTCEVQVRVKPFLRQEFSPIYSKDQFLPQSVIVYGCEMPVDLNSHFAHIKIIEPNPLTRAENQLLADKNIESRDMCMVRIGAAPFQEVMFQVPVSTRKSALEYLVHVKHPQDNSQPLPAYHVCFCFGPECWNTPPSWYTIGTIRVLPGGGDDIRAMDADRNRQGPGSGSELPAHYVNERPCGQQWMSSMDGHGITLDDGYSDINYRKFLCKQDFIDMIGPRWIRCVDGEWYQEEAGVDPEQTETRKHWDGQLPRCRWQYDRCVKPTEEFQYGFMTVENGLARYVCQPDHILTVNGERWAAATYVRWCSPSGGWRPVALPQCIRDTTPQTMPADRAAGQPNDPPEEAGSILEFTAEAHLVRHNMDNNGSAAVQKSSQKTGQHSVQVRSHSGTGTAASSGSMDSSHASARDTLFDTFRTNITTAEITGVGPAAAIAAQGGFAVGSATAAEASDPASDAELPSGFSGRRLSLHKWPTRFERTDDPEHSFIIDRCWITLDCSSDGQLPKDSAASVHFARKPALTAGRQTSSVVFAAAVSLAISLAAMAVITKSKSAQAAAAVAQ